MTTTNNPSRAEVVERLWAAINDPLNDDPRKIVKACEVILRSMPEEGSTHPLTDSETAKRYTQALYK